MSPLARAVAVALLLLLGPSAFACSCINTADPLGAVANHEAVFLGKVIASELVPIGKGGGPYSQGDPGELKGSFRLYRISVLQVTERWRGEVPPFVILATGSGGGDCGYSFETGKSYLVYADRTKDKTLTALAGATPALTTSICTFTAPADEAADAIAKIRASTVRSSLCSSIQTVTDVPACASRWRLQSFDANRSRVVGHHARHRIDLCTATDGLPAGVSRSPRVERDWPRDVVQGH